jgi:hypothetical protein
MLVTSKFGTKGMITLFKEIVHTQFFICRKKLKEEIALLVHTAKRETYRELPSI